MSAILILGSGPNVVESRDWDLSLFDRIIAINNAWQVRSDWNDVICPDDFPIERRPTKLSQGQQIVTSERYVPAQNAFGGFVYAGGTMAFTASYWALATYKPRVIALMGCDMTYAAAGATHFYGTGTADPLRHDISLRNLEAKSNRLMALAAMNNCAMINLSSDSSRLTFPRATPLAAPASTPVRIDEIAVAAALTEEKRLGYFVASGRYWVEENRFDTTAVDALDATWIKAIPPAQTRLSNPPRVAHRCG